MIWVGLKKEETLELYVERTSGRWVPLASYPVQGASGTLGPKLEYGDGQVPEGVYGIESLNPNSSFHLSLRVDYPNTFDRERARIDGRKNLGGDIMIHGGSASIGCLAMGDRAAEELFVLAADTGASNITLLLSPVDFRRHALPGSFHGPPWTPSLYERIKAALSRLPLPEEGV